MSELSERLKRLSHSVDLVNREVVADILCTAAERIEEFEKESDKTVALWKFVSSYKHMFWYENEQLHKTVVIQGDIYRDNFEATMTDKTMEYFKNMDGIIVMDVDHV